MAESARRISIGFEGGSSLGLKVEPEKLDALRKALEGDRERWHRVQATDGEVMVNLGQVVYLLVDSDEHHVGF